MKPVQNCTGLIFCSFQANCDSSLERSYKFYEIYVFKHIASLFLKVLVPQAHNSTRIKTTNEGLDGGGGVW